MMQSSLEVMASGAEPPPATTSDGKLRAGIAVPSAGRAVDDGRVDAPGSG
jgi:hypothetical protein